jgi:endoglycosylceramidase
VDLRNVEIGYTGSTFAMSDRPSPPAAGHGEAPETAAAPSAPGVSAATEANTPSGTPGIPETLGRMARWLTDEAGRVVTLHGVNIVNKLPPYDPAAAGFGEEDARLIRGWGFNTVRTGWIWKALEPEPGRYDEQYLDSIAATVKLLTENGQQAMVDAHQDMYNERFSGEGFPDWAVQDGGLPHRPDLGFPRNYFFMPGLWRAYDNFWANRNGPDGVGLQDRFAAAWRHVAERLRGERAVMYDIFNEPFPGSAAPACANPFGWQRFDRKLGEMSARVVRAIREVEKTKLIMYEPNVLFNNGARTHHPPLGDEKTGLSFHNYCVATTPGMPRLRGGAQDRVCARGEQRVFNNALDHARRVGCALLLSEFGATDDLRTIERVCGLADRNGVGWQYWAYFNTDPSGERQEECIVRDLHAERSGPNVNEAKVEVLSRPYPRAVAGTPRGWSFDGRTGEFTLKYDTRNPHGESRPDDAKTEIFLPGHVYGGSPTIEVKGGDGEVNAETGLLEVRAEEAAEEVTVRLSG